LYPRFAGLNPTEKTGLLRAIKISNTPSFGREVKSEAHAVIFYGM
jgi:hypothetical protein